MGSAGVITTRYQWLIVTWISQHNDPNNYGSSSPIAVEARGDRLKARVDRVMVSKADVQPIPASCLIPLLLETQ